MTTLSAKIGQHYSVIEGFRKIGLVDEGHFLHDMQIRWIDNMLESVAKLQAEAVKLEHQLGNERAANDALEDMRDG